MLSYFFRGFWSVPFFLVPERFVKLDIACVAGGGDLAFLYRLQNGAAVLLGMGTLGVPAFSEVGAEFPHGLGQRFLVEKVEALEIQQGKAGRVGYVSAVGRVAEREQLHLPCGVPSTFGLSADFKGAQRKSGEQAVQQGGFSDAGGAGKCGDLM